MKFPALVIGVAALGFCVPAFSALAQDNPGMPPATQPATPMPSPTTDQPSDPAPNDPAMRPDEPGMPNPGEAMSKPSYGAGWDAKKCAAAEKKGKADPANCPKPEPKS